MREYMLLCNRCRNIFTLPLLSVPSLNRETPCPRCGSFDIGEAPAWAPLGSGQNIFDNSFWEYECQECRQKFKMPIPKSPSEEKKRTCPACHSGHLHLLTDLGAQPLYCG